MTDRCPSSGHDDEENPPPAVIPGVFDCSHINGRTPERATFCPRCAATLEMCSIFTPDETA